MAYILIYLAVSTAGMALALHRSMKKTIYSYLNIGLIGSILFHSVFLIVTARFLFFLPQGEPGAGYTFETILAGSAILGWIAARAVPKYDKDYIIILVGLAQYGMFA